MPAAFTTVEAVFAPDTMPGPLHEKLAGLTLLDPVSVIEVVLQVNSASEPALAVGAVLFSTTNATSVAVHPLAEEVTVKV